MLVKGRRFTILHTVYNIFEIQILNTKRNIFMYKMSHAR